MHYITNIFSWQSDKIYAFSLFHLSIIFLVIVFSIIFIFIGKKQNQKQISLTVFFFGLFFLFLEIYKQLFVNVFEGADSYRWYVFPFQLCSTPLYLCLIYPLLKGKAKKCVSNYLSLYATLAGISVMICADTVLSREVTISLQTMLWHGSMIVLGLYLLTTNNLGKDINEIKSAIFIFSIVFCIAMLLNVTIKKVNLLYLSPYFDNPMDFLNKIRAKTNWFVYAMSYAVGVSIGAFLVWLVAYLIQKIKIKKEKTVKNLE